jgi:hypothetical protein
VRVRGGLRTLQISPLKDWLLIASGPIFLAVFALFM